MTTREDVIQIVEDARARGLAPDLRNLDLRRLNLSKLDLSKADLRGADMRGTNVSCSDLSEAWVYDVNFEGMRAFDTRFCGAYPYILQIFDLPSGVVTFYPTPSGWLLQVGCWEGTLDELRELIAKDDGWPGAQGLEVYNRRPLLEATIALCEAHVAYHADVVRDLREKWGEQRP